MQTWQGKAARAVLIFTGVVVVALVAVLGLLVAKSPGRPQPFLDAAGRPLAGSISEKLRVPINGVEQGMFLAGKDRTSPVLLFVHGGPAMPEYVMSRQYQKVLEELFVVCWWEQRGAGISNLAPIPPETLNQEQLVEDTLEVTRYLRQRFGQERIYLFGHSWGSVIGIQAAARAPELYRAYIGMAQVTKQLESEKRAYAYMLEKYREAGDRKTVEALERHPLPELDSMPAAYRGLRDDAMHRLGVGTTHAMRSVITGIFLPVMASTEYTLGEKVALWRGKWSSHSTAMWNRLLTLDLTARVTRLEIPAYFLHGAFDQTVSYELGRNFAGKLGAPGKGFYTFPESAHSPLFEEPERALKVLREDVLAGRFALADRL